MTRNLFLSVVFGLLSTLPAQAFSAAEYAARVTRELELTRPARFDDLEYTSEAQADSVWSLLTSREAPPFHARIQVSGVALALTPGVRAAWLELPSAQAAEELVVHHLDAPARGEWTVIEIRGSEVVWVRGELATPSQGARIVKALWSAARTDGRASDVVVRSPSGAEAYWSASGRLRAQLERCFDVYQQAQPKDVGPDGLDTVDPDSDYRVQIKRYRNGVDGAFAKTRDSGGLEQAKNLRDRAYQNGSD